MPIKDSHGNEILSAIKVDKTGNTNLLICFEHSEWNTTDVSSHLVESPCNRVGNDMGDRHFDLALLLIELLHVGHALVHLVVVHDVCAWIARCYNEKIVALISLKKLDFEESGGQLCPS